jgi:cyclophilin family peptidyl-prolyl cis-trans isomerase
MQNGVHIENGSSRVTSVYLLILALAALAAGPQAKPGDKTRVQAPPLQAPAPTPAPGNPVVVVSTSMGDITLELFKAQAPVSVDNFLQYVRDGFYEGTIFHRVKPGYVIQGGGYTAEMVERGTRPPILNEATNGLKNVRGSLAMARTRALRSGTSQFFINLVNNTSLDHRGYSPDDFGYAVFGRVLTGMDVVDKIAATPTGLSGEHEDVPKTPVLIQKVTIKEPGQL